VQTTGLCQVQSIVERKKIRKSKIERETTSNGLEDRFHLEMHFFPSSNPKDADEQSAPNKFIQVN
jgi:hypothetical protein